MRKNTISVIITVYNRKKLILRALESVMNQTYDGYEIIIVDDGSTDNVEKLIFPFLKVYSNIIYCRQPNNGNAESLNTGLALSKGKYITFLDSDDSFEKEHLEIRLNYFKKNPEVDLIYSTAKILGNEKDFFVPDARNKKRLIHLNECIIGATFFGKREVFLTLKGFRDIYSHDYNFYKKAIKFYNVCKIDSPTYIYYRNQKNSIINTLKLKNLQV